ncbi:endolytic transglycosylase MltG [Caldibacillus lycopersici]|uniref:Endolytic transglycosylase MltG n=1 Tax=Perspicuibacillus lycopersici TaxID=1325689 RepID=A0AAE3LLH1_9BACI|nr:endolytic transglycosylase MltG [Perspicuibacillus lycopersici]MCU9612340.1 endolytic transglycosylase MltG [Perspicuibacillus lycopersici]
MKINLLSSFAAGLFLSTTICGIVYFSANTNAAKIEESTTQTNTKVLSEAEMKEQLAAKGYVVQTQNEYEKNITSAKATTDKQTDDSQSDNSTEKEKVTSVVVNVAEGMTSYDVGEALNQAKLITEDAFHFSKEIEKRGLQNKLRPGSYTVTNNMSYDEIISTIFK